MNSNCVNFLVPSSSFVHMLRRNQLRYHRWKNQTNSQLSRIETFQQRDEEMFSVVGHVMVCRFSDRTVTGQCCFFHSCSDKLQACQVQEDRRQIFRDICGNKSKAFTINLICPSMFPISGIGSTNFSVNRYPTRSMFLLQDKPIYSSVPLCMCIPD